MPPIITIYMCLLGGVGITASVWALYAHTNLHLPRRAYKDHHNKDVSRGLALLVLSTLVLAGQHFYTAVTAATVTPTLRTQLLWVLAVAFGTSYTHLKLSAAFYDFTRYREAVISHPDISPSVWEHYKAWTYLTRTRYPSAIVVAPIVAVFALFSPVFGIPTVIGGSVAIYSILTVGLASHGSEYFDHAEQKAIIDPLTYEADVWETEQTAGAEDESRVASVESHKDD